MLIANKLSSGFGKPIQFEVTAGGAPIGTINDTRSTFDIGDQHFNVIRSGLLSPKVHLKCRDTLITTANQRPFRNHYTLAFNGKEWTFKAIVLMATKFGLSADGTETGSVSSGPYLNRLKDITADMTGELPCELQLFLLAIFIGQLTSDAN